MISKLYLIILIWIDKLLSFMLKLQDKLLHKDMFRMLYIIIALFIILILFVFINLVMQIIIYGNIYKF
jgi:hypothetical protein